MIIASTEIRPVTATKGSGTVLPAILAGKVVEARLLMALGDGVFRFTSAENEFDLPLPRNLPPGTQVRISQQPGGFYEVTVLDERGAPVRPQAASLPPQGSPAPGPNQVTVRPQAPVPHLPPGQPVEARVVSSTPGGMVRVAAPGGDIDLPLPRPLPPGTTVRITPQAGGTLRVDLPQTMSRPAVPMSVPAAAPPPAPMQPPAPVVHPSVFTVKAEGAPPQLPAGQVVEARVVSSGAAGTVRFAVADTEIDLPLPKTFAPGTQARIVAQPGGTFVVTIRPSPPQISAPIPQAGSSAAAPLPRGVMAAPVDTQPVSTPPARPAVMTIAPDPRLATLPSSRPIEARVVAQPGANGLTRFVAPAGEFELPLPQSLPTGTAVRVVPQPGGGLTLVALPETSESAARPATQSLPQSAEAVRQAVRGAIAKQDGLGKVFSSIADLPFRLNAPMDVRHAAEKLLDQRLPLEFVTRPEQIAKAIAASGIFAERILAGLPQTQANAPPDLKLALFVLRAAFGSWSSVRTDAPPRTEGHIAPPLPGAPPAAQPPANTPPRAMQNMPADEFVPRVLHETDAAISRINLHQFASLPDDRAAAARGDLPDARISCEVPVNVDGRTAIFGFVVERDGRHAPNDREKKKWRVRAAVDLGDTGAIEADVRLRGESVSAGILADRAEIVERLEAALPLLRDGLTAAGFDVENLWVRLGKGTAQPGPPGHFVDRKT